MANFKSTNPWYLLKVWNIGVIIWHQIIINLMVHVFLWNLVSNDSGNATLSRVDEDGETVTIQQNLGGGNYTYLNTDTDFTKIPHTMKYSIKDAYQTWGDSIIIDSRNPHSSEVDFVDNVTSPSVYGYLATSRSRTKVPLASSTLEHLGGYVYMKKTLWGYLN